MKKGVAVDKKNVNKQLELVVLFDDGCRYHYRHVIRHLAILFFLCLSWDCVYAGSVDVVCTFSIVRRDRTIQNAVVPEDSSVFQLRGMTKFSAQRASVIRSLDFPLGVV